MFLEFCQIPTQVDDTIAASTINDVTIVPGCTFQKDYCVFCVVESNEFYLIAKVLQTRNSLYICGNNNHFDNIDEIKALILNMHRQQ